MTHTKDFYHLLLTYALIEIRAAETPEEKARIRKIADMLHNVGAALCFPWTEERDEDIYSYIQMKAEVHGLLDHDDVRPLGQVERDLAQGLVAVGRVHLIAAAVAELRRRFGRVAERAVEAGGVLGRVAHDGQPGKAGGIEAAANGADH